MNKYGIYHLKMIKKSDHDDDALCIINQFEIPTVEIINELKESFEIAMLNNNVR